MPKPTPLVGAAIWFTVFLVSCGAALNSDGQGGGSVDQFGAADNMVYEPTIIGDVVCFQVPQCLPTQVVYVTVIATQAMPMATRTPTSTIVIEPTSTLAPTWTHQPATPTMVTPDGTYITPIGNPEKCAVEPYAVREYGIYTYLDAVNSGIQQRIRSRPGTDYPIVGYLPKNQPMQTYWLKWLGGTRWYALDYNCQMWVSGALGSFVNN